MVTSLLAVALPAYADEPQPDPNAVASSLQAAADPASSTTDPASDPATAAPTEDPSSEAATPDPAETTTPPADDSNPLSALTDPPASCTAALGGDPTKIQTCLTDAAAAAGGGGGTPSLPPQLAALQTFLTCASKVTDLESGKACGTALFEGLGIPKTDCLDPALDPILAALDGLITDQDPTKLQAELEGLGTELPKELAQVQECVNPTPTDSPSPTPTPTPTQSTTESNGAATADPIAAVAVVADPVFTG
jgi:hypothetical protein